MKKATARLALALALSGAGGPAVASPAPSDRPLSVFCGRSLLFPADSRLERVAISDPLIADVRVVSPTEVLVRGLKPGEVTLMVWTKKSGVRSYRVQVGVDTQTVERQMRELTDNAKLKLGFNGRAFLLSGVAASSAQRDLAEKIVGTYGHPVVNLAQLPEQGNQIAIDVYVVELSKNASLNLGLNYGGGQETEIANGIRKYIFKPGEILAGEQTTNDLRTFGRLDFLAAKLNAMQQRGEAKLLAHPRLVTVDGGTAKFLAGGEVPIPIAQALGTLSISWKEFGVRLEIQPKLTRDGRIAMKIQPEVSSLDFLNGLKQASYTIPAIKTRRAETQVVLSPRETLMLGGLMNAEQNHSYSLLPGLGEIPILGELFKSRNFQDNQTELAILVSPSMVAPGAEATLPERLPDVQRELSRPQEP